MVEADRKATLCPSALIEGVTLLPLEGSGTGPAGRLANVVFFEQAVPADTLRQVFRTKMFSTPGVTFGPRLEPCVANATYGPAVVEQVVVEAAPLAHPSERLGFSLIPFAGVVPLAVEARYVLGRQVVPVATPVHVSRTKIC